AGEGVIVRARLRPMHRAAVTPQWRTDGADAGTSGALLLPQLLARTRHPPAILGGVRAGPLRGAEVPHRLPQKIFVNRSEDLIRPLWRPPFAAAHILDFDGCHKFPVAGPPPPFAFPSWPLAWPPSTDRPSPSRQSHAALWAASWLW